MRKHNSYVTKIQIVNYFLTFKSERLDTCSKAMKLYNLFEQIQTSFSKLSRNQFDFIKVSGRKAKW